MMPDRTSSELPDKDAPLRDDIRLLGRLLGDTVRQQEGDAVFELVERIRQTSIRFHRDEDEGARHGLETTLNGLTRTQTIQIIRAFSFFSHLANPPFVGTAHRGRLTGEAREKAAAEGARTVPPREHGGNCDIKDLSRGSKIYFPVYVDGAGLAASANA